MTIVLSGIAALILTAVFGRFLIPVLRAMKAGQSIKEIGPSWHMSKQGTPTMGGIMFMAAITICVVVFGWKDFAQGQFASLFVLVFALVYGAIGFVDDYAKVKKHENTGLTAGWKFLLQLAAAVAFLALLRATHHLSANLYIPFVNTYLTLPWPVCHRGLRQLREPHRRSGRPCRVGDAAGGGVLRRAVRDVESRPRGRVRRGAGRRSHRLPDL